ncbi:MAG: PspC domain-containing protein [Treponema sp.]|nr:PspC domain-containing protein [Treponema sp.]
MKQLKKSNKKIIAGVCGGIAEYFKIDPTIVRLIVALIILFTSGIGLIMYIVAAIVMPTPDFSDDDINNMKSANVDSSEYESKKGRSDYEKEEGKSTPHSNEEFDKFFKK